MWSLPLLLHSYAGAGLGLNRVGELRACLATSLLTCADAETQVHAARLDAKRGSLVVFLHRDV